MSTPNHRATKSIEASSAEPSGAAPDKGCENDSQQAHQCHGCGGLPNGPGHYASRSGLAWWPVRSGRWIQLPILTIGQSTMKLLGPNDAPSDPVIRPWSTRFWIVPQSVCRTFCRAPIAAAVHAAGSTSHNERGRRNLGANEPGRPASYSSREVFGETVRSPQSQAGASAEQTLEGARVQVRRESPRLDGGLDTEAALSAMATLARSRASSCGPARATR
jgi:hypothetical protein